MFFFLALNKAKNLLVLPHHVPIKQCSKPKPGPYSRVNKFEVDNTCVSATYRLTTLGWIIASALSRSKENGEQSHIPGWAGFKSLVSAVQCLTQVGALPLLPEVAHEWPTMLTVILKASELKTLVVGEYPTVISFDMALYEKAVQLLDTRLYLKIAVVPRLGELHDKLRNRWCMDWGWHIHIRLCHNQTDPQVRPLQENSSCTHPHLYGSIWTFPGIVLHREAQP